MSKAGHVAMTEERYAALQAKSRPDFGKSMKEVITGMHRALAADAKPTTRSKHGAVKTVIDCERFDSKLEAKCWQDLKLREKAGEIGNLRRQVRFSLFAPGGEHFGTYKADFVYEVVPWNALPPRRVVADCKSRHTASLQAWKKTKLMMMSCHNIDVLELP